MKRIAQSRTPSRRPPRGIALLLVMIGLVVCSLLVAGFLQSQGTAIGIAQNERDSEKARALAQSGIDLCYWQVRNRSDWRTAMSPGTWLNNLAIGDGSVTVTAASGDGTSSFINDTTQPVLLTSTASISGRTYTLTASIGPTGGGAIFRGGNFCQGRITLGNNNLDGLAVVDSYNSANAPYNILLPGNSAVFGTSYAGNDALLVYFLSAYRGTFVGSPSESLSGAVYGTLGALLPVSTSLASQPFTMGAVIIPNTTGLPAEGALSRSISSNLSTPGNYDQITLNANGLLATNTTVTTSGIYHVTGNLTINSQANLVVADGVSAVFVVDGSVTLTGNIKLTGAGTLDLYVNGNLSLSGSAAINSSGGNTASFTLFGTGNGTVSLTNTSQIVGAIYAPQSTVTLQNSTPKIYGAIMASQLNLQDASAFHFDQNLENKVIHNITGGSAPAGAADYTVSYTGNSTTH